MASSRNSAGMSHAAVADAYFEDEHENRDHASLKRKNPEPTLAQSLHQAVAHTSPSTGKKAAVADSEDAPTFKSVADEESRSASPSTDDLKETDTNSDSEVEEVCLDILRESQQRRLGDDPFANLSRAARARVVNFIHARRRARRRTAAEECLKLLKRSTPADLGVDPAIRSLFPKFVNVPAGPRALTLPVFWLAGSHAALPPRPPKPSPRQPPR
mmetsp:Transcript_14047/g.33194  ORF Transcript_14047/g.33194 Transcript_14047/m.33194 type:complete len:215 (-) Transcript_14047:67-711(-)